MQARMGVEKYIQILVKFEECYLGGEDNIKMDLERNLTRLN